jgi:hypothetical protein
MFDCGTRCQRASECLVASSNLNEQADLQIILADEALTVEMGYGGLIEPKLYSDKGVIALDPEDAMMKHITKATELMQQALHQRQQAQAIEEGCHGKAKVLAYLARFITRDAERCGSTLPAAEESAAP